MLAVNSNFENSVTSFKGKFLSKNQYLKVLKESKKKCNLDPRRNVASFKESFNKFLADDGKSTIERWEQLASKLPEDLHIQITRLRPTIRPNNNFMHPYDGHTVVDFVNPKIGKREIIGSSKLPRERNIDNQTLACENYLGKALETLEKSSPMDLVKKYVEMMQVELRSQLFDQQNVRLDSIIKRINHLKAFVEKYLPQDADKIVKDLNNDLADVIKNNKHPKGSNLLKIKEFLGVAS